MAPSATETVLPSLEDIKQKVVPNAERKEEEKKSSTTTAVASDPVPRQDEETKEHPEIEEKTAAENGHLEGGAVGSTTLLREEQRQQPVEAETEADSGSGSPTHKEPLKLSGALNGFEQFDVTPIIGREFVGVDLAEWLRAPNSDELIRDLAITISRRGVVFFRKQDNITNDLQKELVNRLGQLSGKPSSSTLHIHPVINAGRDDGGKDNEISVISSEQNRKLYSKAFQKARGAVGMGGQSQRLQWHSDITFEPVPSDYALLRLTQLPKTGGDTLWASGYELYDRISKPLRGLFDSLTAHYAQPGFTEAAKTNNFSVYSAPRGSPHNVGEVLEATHPVVRTNPVTGWRSIFSVGTHCQRINGLADAESEHFLRWFVTLIMENHDIQIRHRWQNVNDLAIWDNRSVYHAATPDFMINGDLGERKGSRAVSLGERPYFDPQSVSRREGLAAEGMTY